MTDLHPEDYSIWSDLHKDAYGFRPRYTPPFSTRDEYNAEMDRLASKIADEQVFLDECARERGFASHNVWVSFRLDQEEAHLNWEYGGNLTMWEPIIQDHLRHMQGADDPLPQHKAEVDWEEGRL